MTTQHMPAAAAASSTIWTPEDKAFWEREGRRSPSSTCGSRCRALFLAFAVWQVWSVVAVNLPALGFKFSTDQLFWLAAAPALSRRDAAHLLFLHGADLRRPALDRDIHRHPADPGHRHRLRGAGPTTSYPTMLILALLCGFGGGNFASSAWPTSASSSPRSARARRWASTPGWAISACPSVQFLSPLVVTAGDLRRASAATRRPSCQAGQTVQVWAQNAAFIWVPFIALAALAAWFGMNDIADAKASFADQAVIFRRKHNWLMCWLYLGTFGSFIGYAAGFPLLIKSQFPQRERRCPTPGWARWSARWSGPSAAGCPTSSAARSVTFWNFVVMALAVVRRAVLPALGRLRRQLHGFLVMFMLLFLTTGIGNGSTFRMIPVIFLNERQRAAAGKGTAAQEQASRDGNTRGRRRARLLLGDRAPTAASSSPRATAARSR